jgi:hypothetical protein
MFGFLLQPGVSCPPPRRAAGRARSPRRGAAAARAGALALLALGLGAGCGDQVLVGSWQLRSLSDAGADTADDIAGDVADAGAHQQSVKAEASRRKEAAKAERRDNHPDEKGH